MLGPIENGLGLDIVVWLQAHGNALFDLLAQLLHSLGGSLFPLLVMPVFYWSVDKRLGQRMLFMLLLGGLITVCGKELLRTPRPYILHADEVDPLVTEIGFGIPSGHVINVLALWLPVVVWAGSRRVWWAYGGFALLMAWSRVYAGMHYPQDVLVSLLIVGPLLIVCYARCPLDPLIQSRALLGMATI
ncbi:MAG: phosphatase PAP2 family protein, partial [Anaerolineae bacterium]|nr:phosphatase PAP2 family protein [Anaerolineae bacterium]